MKFRTIINFNVSRTTFFLSFHFVHLSSICCVLTHLWPHSPTSLETWNMKHSFKHNRPIIHPLRLLVCRVDRQDLGVNDAPRHWPSLFLTQKIQINEIVVPPPPTRVLIFFVFLLAATQTHRQNQWTWNTRRDDATGISVEVDECEIET